MVRRHYLTHAIQLKYGTVQLKYGNGIPLHWYCAGGNTYWLECRNLCYTWIVAGKQKSKNLKGLRILCQPRGPALLLDCNGSAGLVANSRLWRTGSICLHGHVKWQTVQETKIGKSLCFRPLWSLNEDCPVIFTKPNNLFPVCTLSVHCLVESTSTCH